jgi:histidyl-tRNA synthetase
MQKAPPTPKGFRDIPPELAAKRRKAINKIVDVLEEFEFSPIETPTIEFAETLKGKYGEEERLIYEFEDRGGRKLSLRYDLTVPLARYVATYNPALPFRRYQLGQVFRGENPQAGRHREFTQLDFDTVGSESLEEDAKTIACAIKATRSVGLNDAVMAINDRRVFNVFPPEVVRAIDKVHKISIDGVKKELKVNKIPESEIKKAVDYLENPSPTKSPDVERLITALENAGLKDKSDFYFDHTLARGLDYYTGSIFELKPAKDPASLSIGSGGRYDNLIGIFAGLPAGKKIPAVGFSFGIDRLVDLLK